MFTPFESELQWISLFNTKKSLNLVHLWPNVKCAVHWAALKEGASSFLDFYSPLFICFVSCSTYQAALHIKMLVGASAGGECESSWPWFPHAVCSSRHYGGKMHKGTLIFDIPPVLITYLVSLDCAVPLVLRGSAPQQDVKMSLTLALSMFLYLQVIRKGEVSCCWICTTCKDNEYVQDEFTCKACELGWWPDEELAGRPDKNLKNPAFFLFSQPVLLTYLCECWLSIQRSIFLPYVYCPSVALQPLHLFSSFGYQK